MVQHNGVVLNDADEVDHKAVGAVDRSHAGHAGVWVYLDRPAVVTPRQLPPPPRLFTNRIAELSRLTAASDELAQQKATVVVSAVGGTGGIGKTSLVLHWAHQHAEQFPDGQLFVDLRGFDPSRQPMSTAEAVRGFVDALAGGQVAIPAGIDAQVGLYRSLAAGRRMLIVLDNARDSAQVTPLLPGSPTCMVVVTSRHYLAGLISAHGARSVDLDVLSDAEAYQFLADQLGKDRLTAEPAATADLVACCAGLPLALSIISARASRHPEFPLTLLADELRNQATRLDGFEAGEIPLDLRAVFSTSYADLPSEAATLFGLLGLAPGPDIGLLSAASLIGLPVARTRKVLRELEVAHLVAQPVPGRYRMHDLIRLFATAQAHESRTEDVRRAGLRRLVDFFLHTASTGYRLIDPVCRPVELAPPVSGCHPHFFSNLAAALEWFDAEHDCFLPIQQAAMERGWYTTGWQLPWVLDAFCRRRGHVHERLASWQLGLNAANHDGDKIAICYAKLSLAGYNGLIGRYDEALAHLQDALHLARTTNDRPSEAFAHAMLAGILSKQGHNGSAVDHATKALHLYQVLNLPMLEADALNAIAWHLAQAGHHQEALGHCQNALDLFSQHPYPKGEADLLDTMGYVAHHTGRHDDALDYYKRALALYREIGMTTGEAITLEHVGHTYVALGQHEPARQAWDTAQGLYCDQYLTADRERVQQQLASLEEYPGNIPNKPPPGAG